MSQQVKGSIFIVIVLYEEIAAQSRTVCSLNRALAEMPELIPHFSVLLYDNSWHPEPIPPDLLPGRVEAMQPGRNLGLAAAYNEALGRAEEQGFSWLLLLDSDTQISREFLAACVRAVSTLSSNAQIGAAVPHVVEGSSVHSPRYIEGIRRRPVPRAWEGVFPREVVALNSGSLVRVRAIRELGGFNREFWLDYLDYWLYRAMQRNGYKVHVITEEIEHSLSFADPTERMTVERYRNMLEAECFFTVRYGTRGERVRLRILLVKRAAAFRLKRNGRPYVYALLASALHLNSSAKPPEPPEG
jgi:glycosyltransferase involved in cell wall biosynthesis